MLSEPTSQARDARCLSVASAPETIVRPRLNLTETYLRKLGWPGVCEFGAAVVLGIGGAATPLAAGIAAMLTTRSRRI